MDAQVKKAANKAHALDEASQTLRTNARKKWNKAIVFAVGAFLALCAIGVAGILYQNHYALQSKQHIDCIIKDLSTPQKPGTTHKYIDPRSSLTKDCNIKFN